MFSLVDKEKVDWYKNNLQYLVLDWYKENSTVTSVSVKKLQIDMLIWAVTFYKWIIGPGAVHSDMMCLTKFSLIFDMK